MPTKPTPTREEIVSTAPGPASHTEIESKRSGPVRYVVTTYLTFWLMVLALCGSASMVFHAPPLVMRILSDVCAWSPTLVLFVLLPRLRPGTTRGAFLRSCFAGRIRPGLLALCVLVTGGVFLLSVALSSHWTGSVFSCAGPVWLSVVLSVLSGPTGEECGWRGYLRPELEGRFGFLRGNLLLGVIWAFWHTVLWVVDNEFTSGWPLLVYVLSNVLVMTALNIIMAVVLERAPNLLYACLIHLCFNLPYSFLTPTIPFYIALMILYVLAAAAMLLVRRSWQRRQLTPTTAARAHRS